LVLPKAGSIQVNYTSEFTDKFLFNDILGIGIGFPDDGINNRKFKAVAIGDSFTRGVGSVNNLKNGWVELIESKNDNIDIINLGHLGKGINDQKYAYDKLKKIIKHNIVIYNFFSGGDYFDNLNDINYSFYINKIFDKIDNEEVQNIINDFNIRHGYKYHLEYLSNNDLKSYSIYFILKSVDFLISKDLFPKYKFKYNKPKEEARLNLVDDGLFKIFFKRNSKFICEKKYCFEENSGIFKDKEIKNKIIVNSAQKINEFYQEIKKDNKKFVLVIHPSARNFYSNKTEINYNKLDEQLLQLLDPRIDVIYLVNELLKQHTVNDKNIIFYKYDGHYNFRGYKIVSDIINDSLIKILK